MPTKYDPNTKAKAIRLVREHRGDYPLEYAAITAVARRLGMTPRRCASGCARPRSMRGQRREPAPRSQREAAGAAARGRLHVRAAGRRRVRYTAFVIDAFAGLITGWECSLASRPRRGAPVRQAAAWRARQGHPLGSGAVHHSDAGSQYTSVQFAQALLLAGLMPSIGTVGDAYDNALAETTIGLYKTECTRAGFAVPRGPYPVAGGPGGDHKRLGALVQHQPADAPAGPPAPGRSRGGVLEDRSGPDKGTLAMTLIGLRGAGGESLPDPRASVRAIAPCQARRSPPQGKLKPRTSPLYEVELARIPKSVVTRIQGG